MSGVAAQQMLYRALRKRFAADSVVSEWSVRRGASDALFQPATYAPRLDIAVGPFNVSYNRRHEDATAIRAFAHPFVSRLEQAIFEQNQGARYDNPNPRCLIAIEIETTTSSKHILGGITNASLLGRIGVIVAPTHAIDKVRRIHAYACVLKAVEKARPDMFGNVGCFDQKEFVGLLRAAS